MLNLVFSYIHNESSAHKYAVSWTTARNSSHKGDAGGSFFIADYRIRVRAAKDTVVVWKPADWHGTALAHCDPDADDPGFYQAGLSIVTPASLTNLWKRVHKGEISRKAAEEEMVANGERPPVEYTSEEAPAVSEEAMAMGGEAMATSEEAMATGKEAMITSEEMVIMGEEMLAAS
jgi:hypothetical protein